MTAHVLGLDLGLAHAGAAQLHTDGQLRTQRYSSEAPASTATPAEVARRITTVVRWAVTRATTYTKLAVIEEMPHAIGAHGSRDERAAVIWTVVGHLDRHGVPVALINPASLKQRISGNGRADKDEVRRAVAALYPRQGLHQVSHDEADAAGLATLGVCRLAAIHGDPWRGPWLDARALNLESGCRWPTELQTTPAQRPPAPLPMFEVPR